MDDDNKMVTIVGTSSCL